jgi:hypothetical protein
VGLSTPEFNAKVRDLVEPYFNVVDSFPPTGTPGGLPLRGPGVVPHDAVVVAFSANDGSQDRLEETINEEINAVVSAFPESEYYFVFPDDQPEEPLELFIEKLLNERAPSRSVVSLRNLVFSLEERLVQLSGRSPGIGSAQAFVEIGRVVNEELFITFDPSLSAAQTKATLTALAEYYRACGGVGLPAEFESQEAFVLEDARV